MKSPMRVNALVQDIPYAKSNCYVHQLCYQLQGMCDLHMTTLNDVLRNPSVFAGYDHHISLLQQRKILQNIGPISRAYGKIPVTIYDQDPWESYRDCATHNAHFRFRDELNVRRFIVTTRYWANRMKDDGLPAEFARIWILPEYCDVGPRTEARNIQVGFIGTLHAYRRPLMESLIKSGTNIQIASTNALPYGNFLHILHDVGIYVYSADNCFTVDGVEHNLRQSLWAKDVEAMARGCWVVRERSSEFESFIDPEMRSFSHFDNFQHAHDVIEDVIAMNADERRAIIETAVDHIRNVDCWRDTATMLLAQ